MLSFFPFLAAKLPQNDLLAGYESYPGAFVVVVFLFLLCSGVALNVALVVYFLKRPSNPEKWGVQLAFDALPGRSILFLSMLFMAMYLGCSILYGHFFPAVEDIEASTLWFQGLLFNLPVMLILMGVLVYFRMTFGSPVQLTWRKRISLIGLAILLYLATFPVVWLYGVLYNVYLYLFEADPDPQAVMTVFAEPVSDVVRIVMYVVAILIVPISEELFFRGVLFPWAIRKAGYWPAVGMISALFAAMHMHLPSAIPLFLLSTALCVAYSRTRSLLVPVVMHACFNGVSLLLLGLMN